jgi:hypothetical protein
MGMVWRQQNNIATVYSIVFVVTHQGAFTCYAVNEQVAVMLLALHTMPKRCGIVTHG